MELLNGELVIPELLINIYIFIIGMCLGSFFMLVGDRIPRQETLTGRSHCEHCQKKLVFWQLFPVISYLVLRGKCHYCTSKIGLFSPLFELLSGSLFLLSARLLNQPIPIIACWTMLSLLLIVSVTDIKYQLIPNKVLAPFLILAMIEACLLYGVERWWQPVMGFLVGFLPLFLLTLLKGEAMGGGDIKLFAILGLFLGPAGIIGTLFLSALLALIFYAILFSAKQLKNRMVPFGPFISIGAIIVFLMTNTLL